MHLSFGTTEKILSDIFEDKAWEEREIGKQ